MKRTTLFLRITLATALSVGSLLVGEKVSVYQPSSFISQAEARVGRPLTPMSYAGVARRTTRRAVVVRSTVYRPGCIQAVDAYGRIYWRC
jgi:hypothetical protein